MFILKNFQFNSILKPHKSFIFWVNVSFKAKKAKETWRQMCIEELVVADVWKGLGMLSWWKAEYASGCLREFVWVALL